MTLKSTTGRIVFIEGGERLVYREGLGLEFVIDYDLKKKKFQSSVWRVVSFLCWRLRPEKKKVPVVCLAGCRLRPEKKKVRVVCLAGCQFLVLAITTGKKKSSSRLSGGL